MKSDMTYFWSGLGIAAIILAVCLGIGGCCYLIKKGDEGAEKAFWNSPGDKTQTIGK